MDTLFTDMADDELVAALDTLVFTYSDAEIVELLNAGLVALDEIEEV